MSDIGFHASTLDEIRDDLSRIFRGRSRIIAALDDMRAALSVAQGRLLGLRGDLKAVIADGAYSEVGVYRSPLRLEVDALEEALEQVEAEINAAALVPDHIDTAVHHAWKCNNGLMQQLHRDDAVQCDAPQD
jgi:hypothetical protein